MPAALGIYRPIALLRVAAHVFMEQAVTLADYGKDIQRAKLCIDARMKMAKYHAPNEYGDGKENSKGVTVVIRQGLGAAGPSLEVGVKVGGK